MSNLIGNETKVDRSDGINPACANDLLTSIKKLKDSLTSTENDRSAQQGEILKNIDFDALQRLLSTPSTETKKEPRSRSYSTTRSRSRSNSPTSSSSSSSPTRSRSRNYSPSSSSSSLSPTRSRSRNNSPLIKFKKVSTNSQQILEQFSTDSQQISEQLPLIEFKKFSIAKTLRVLSRGRAPGKACALQW